MPTPPADPNFERALAAEIMASEQMRVRVLAAVLMILFLIQQAIFLSPLRETLQHFAQTPLPAWLPLAVIGPFAAYEILVIFILRYRAARGLDMPTPARFGNAFIETSLPTVMLWWISSYITPALAFSSWLSMLYFFYIAASTLRLNFVLPAFTGAVAAFGYLAIVYAKMPFDSAAADPVMLPIYHLMKAGVLLGGGIIAGLVALRLRGKFQAAMEAAAARERVTNLFGQHVSPAVVDRLLTAPEELPGERREVCVMFLDIRNFTANARSRSPEDVVAFLNDAFAFMIESVDRNGGFINKFLGAWATSSWPSSARRWRIPPPRAMR
jgi:adenylate cyclase